MGKAYPIELRQRVLAYREHMGTALTANKLGVSPAWVRRVLQRHRERGGDIASGPEILVYLGDGPRTGGGARAACRKINLARLADLARERPDATLRELAEALGVTKSAVWKAMRGLGL